MVKNYSEMELTEKNAYENPRMEIVRFQPVDIITMSASDGGADDSGWTGYY